MARHLTMTAWDELRLWWALHGELNCDLLTYYAICCANGLYSGWVIGCWMAGRAPW